MDYTKDFFGYNLVWFIGEVEDRLDPLYLGRVRVRCFGWHSNDKELQPTTALPWANVLNATNDPAGSSSGLTIGVWVFGFFMDGSKAQRPVVLGHLPGYRYGSPGQSELNAVGVEEADYTAGATGVRDANRKEDIIIDPESGSTWSEPANPADAVYPTTKTDSHESGSFMMYTGSGRVMIYSAGAGNYIEMQAGGDGTVKINADGYRLVAGSDNIDVAGDVNITVGGNVNWNVGGNITYNVGGDVKWIVGGNHDQEIAGNKTETIAGDKTVDIGGNENVTAGGSIIRTAGPLYKIDAAKVIIG